MAKEHAAHIWSLNYRLLMLVISAVSPAVEELGLDLKELFLLAAVDDHPHPAELAVTLCMPKPTVTVYVKRLEAAGFVRREIDAADLRRHRLQVTAPGRKALTRGLAILSEAFGGRLARLSAAEQSQFRAALEKMSEPIAQRDGARK